ncbi:MAG: PEP-CTERM sorting domain-containing protein [Opitutaceae bacterium]|jgi:hypothetical protein|nr:PEP-CTERM sorting domain-containing protein [Opitutaceae bacterium]
MKTRTSPRTSAAALGLLASALAIGLPITAHATLIAYEGFDYTADTATGLNQSNGSLNGGTGWGSNQRWFDNQTNNENRYVVSDAGLSYGTLVTTGNALTQGTDTIGAVRFFKNDSTTLADGTYYVSFLISFAANNVSTAGQYGGVQLGSVYFGFTNADIDGGVTTTREFVASNGYGSGTTGTTKIYTGETMTPGQTYLFVAKMVFSATGEDSYSLWINPTTSDESNAGLAQAVNTSTNSSSIASAVFYASSTAFGMTVDEFRLGTTWEDVTPGLPASAVPEPAMWAALTGLAGLAGAILRRRR